MDTAALLHCCWVYLVALQLQSGSRERKLTTVHGHAPVLDPADVAAELVLLLAVLDQLGLDGEAPHGVQVAAAQLHLVENLGTNFDDFVSLELERNTSSINKGAWCCFIIGLTVTQTCDCLTCLWLHYCPMLVIHAKRVKCIGTISSTLYAIEELWESLYYSQMPLMIMQKALGEPFIKTLL